MPQTIPPAPEIRGGGGVPRGERLFYTNVSGSGNPFPRMTGGSSSFRIPALVTLPDGSLFAAADARWNTTYDGGGLDTMVARSKDGVSWEWAFVNYLGDNGDEYDGAKSTCFIDPALAADGMTLYLLADLYPYGVALNGSGNTQPTTETGFNDKGKLLLKKNSGNYDYYLDDGKIKSLATHAVEAGYTVDGFFNVTQPGGKKTNLFFKNSDFKVQRTSYLYLRKSQDGGTTWSAPMLIPLKKNTEKAYLVGPGRGIVTQNGRIVFPCYSHNGSNNEKMNFIYSDDGGQSWQRSEDSPPGGGNVNWSSESAVVELRDGTLRFFFRNGTSRLCYRDYKNGWKSAVTTDRKTNSNTQLSALIYSKKKDGKQVVLVSCPTGPNRQGSNQSDGPGHRRNGEIFIGIIQDDNGIDWDAIENIKVTKDENQFMYSCLGELPNGRIALLYENKQNGWGTGDDKYFTLNFKIFPALSF